MTRTMRWLFAIAAIAVLTAGGIGVALVKTLHSPTRNATIGIVRETQIRIAPETNGRLQRIAVAAGHVQAGDVLAVLLSPELHAVVNEAQAAAAQARASRDNIRAGVRKEQRDITAENVRIAQANLTFARQQHERTAKLAAKDIASQQSLDEVTAVLHKAEAGLAMQQAIKARDEAGPTKEEVAQAEAKVELADAATARLQAALRKITLVAPTDGSVGNLIGLPGEVISPGQSVVTLNADGQRWISFVMLGDRLNGLDIGATVPLVLSDGTEFKGRVTELRPLGEFATWRAARAVGDHDLNSFLVRVEPISPAPALEAGMSVWLRSR